MRKQTGSRNRGWLPMIRRRLESYGGHVGNRLSMAVGVALAAGMLAALAPQAEAVSATCGSVTNYTLNGTNWTAHIFKTAGTTNLNVSVAGNVEVLVVGGGGGGNGGDNANGGGGGGGAGGLIYTNFTAVVSNYTIAVGAGGLGGTDGQYTSTQRKGSDSTAFGFTAIGGGGGARFSGQVSPWTGGNGGSGGGGYRSGSAEGTNTVGQGSNGGKAGNNGSNDGGGGGGGAGAAGSNGTTTVGGKGGNGLAYDISGVMTNYAGGGGGGADTGGASTGGLGGGGAGGANSASAKGTAGTDGTGGGGGGGGVWTTSTGGLGGSGIVIVRYVTPGIAVGTNLLDFGSTVFVNTTNVLTNTVSGVGLTDNITITVTPSSVYGISTNAVDYFSSLTLTTNASGAVPATNIYVRFTPTSAGSYPGAITNISGSVTQTVTLAGTAIDAGAPLLTVSPDSLGLGNVITNKTSADFTYTLSGILLQGDVTVTAPSSYFKVATNGGTFGSTVTVATNAPGSLSATTINVQFTPSNGSGPYAGSITNSSSGAANKMVALTGVGVVPGISVGAGTVTFGSVVTNTTSSNQSFTLSGSNLQDNVTVTAPAAFAVSTNSATGFGQSCTVSVANVSSPSGGSLASTPVYVRFTPSAGAGSAQYSGSIANSSAGAATQTAGVSGTGVVQTIYISGGTLDLGSVVTGKFSWVATSYTVSGSYLTANVTVNPPAGFQVSASSGSGFGTSLTLTQSGGTLAPTTVYVRFVPTLAQSYAGASIANSSAGAVNALQEVTGTGVAYGSKTSTGGDAIYIRTVSGTDYYVHVFTNNGTFTPKTDLKVEYLVVAGGGGGGYDANNYGSGGGGAGGLLTGSTSVLAQVYAIVVGNYGARGGSVQDGFPGGNSSFTNSSLTNLVAIGGGGGAGAAGGGNAATGGSGGGGWHQRGQGSGTPGQGYSGGTGGVLDTGGGGGGGGAPGNNANAGSNPGYGGIGVVSSISGTNVYYAGGGGGGGNSTIGQRGLGGQGGGGDGGYDTTAGINGQAYTGGGGGGGGGKSQAGNGGSGIVIIRYETPPPKGTVIMMR